MEKKLLVFASGSKDGGGSGFEGLINAGLPIVAVVSNHEHGGVRKIADKYGITFCHFPMPRGADEYQKILDRFQPTHISLSGWLKLTVGLPENKTINIHPGILPELGGAGMYGDNVHKEAFKRFQSGDLEDTAVTMHCVTAKYDDGPIIFEFLIPIAGHESWESLKQSVREAEQHWQPIITKMFVNGEISWSGDLNDPVVVPEGYEYLPKAA